MYGIELAWNVDFTPVNPQVYRPQVNTADDKIAATNLNIKRLYGCTYSMPRFHKMQLKYTVVIGEKR